MTMLPVHQKLLAWSLYAALSLLLFSGVEAAGGFWWSDAPRHAMNGAFLLDFFRSDSWTNPIGFAYDYYRQYPAITLPFYPPLLPLVEAFFFSLFGVSHGVALGVAWLFLWMGMGFLYLLAARFLPFFPALMVGTLAGILPEAAFWGRQVMLDVPATTWLLASAYALVRYKEDGSTRLWPLLASLFFLASCYTRQTSLFFLPVLALVLRPGLSAWLAMGVGLLPLAAMSAVSGQVNLSAVVAGLERYWPWLLSGGSLMLLAGWQFRQRIPWEGLTRGLLLLPALLVTADLLHILPTMKDLEWGIRPLDIFYYSRVLPLQMGWPAALVTVSGLALAAWRPLRPGLESWRLLVPWMVAGYLLFSLVGLKSTRFTLPILMPALLFSIIAFSRLLSPKMLSAMTLVLALSTFATTWMTRPVPYLDGYRQAVEEVTRLAPRGTHLLFSGLRDGAFIFNLRCLENGEKYSVTRADKLFFQVAVSRGFGLTEQPDLPKNPKEILDMLNRYGIGMVVFQPDFWDDLTPMQHLAELLDSPAFRLVTRIPVTAHHLPPQEKALLIYVNESLPSGAKPSERPNIPVPLANRVVPGGAILQEK